ncbi:Ctf8-domain-containing protein [Phanerochaete sordida]|uniref:Ctf8-domain-containing protein n=1 Tax=Phanerochaete sordida TaxID=48140 RepID=A0A9P3GEG9_9APHY|nr:Ctf8-domain-containing protein [Phanerochaete sordida]
MIIPINVNIAGPSTRSLPPTFAQYGTDEVVLVELQGALEVEGSSEGQFVGKLTVDSDSKKPTLRIGHHLLEGKLVNLNKPFAVMHKQARPEDVEQESDRNSPFATESSTPPQWDIIAVVKRKMVFAKRPMPIVGRPVTTEPPV